MERQDSFDTPIEQINTPRLSPRDWAWLFGVVSMLITGAVFVLTQMFVSQNEGKTRDKSIAENKAKSEWAAVKTKEHSKEFDKIYSLLRKMQEEQREDMKELREGQRKLIWYHTTGD